MRTDGKLRGKGSKDRGQKDSLEDHVDPSQMYEYFREQTAGQSKKAEGDRAKINRILEINKLMRQYDLKKIKEQEVEDITTNV